MYNDSLQHPLPITPAGAKMVVDYQVGRYLAGYRDLYASLVTHPLDRLDLLKIAIG